MLKKIRHTWALLVIVMLLSPLCVSAQISVGAKVGVQQNQFTQPGSTLGFSAGAYASYQVLPFLNVKLEPQYAQHGGARRDYYVYYNEIDGNIYSIGFINPSIIMHAVEIPLLAELTLPEFEDEAIVPKLIIGGSYSLMAKATQTSTMRYNFSDGSPAVDVGYRHQNVTDNYARNQFSGIVGLGVLFKTDSRDFQFDIRYRQGFTQVNQIKYPDAIQSAYGAIGGNLYTSSLSINFSMTIFKF